MLVKSGRWRVIDEGADGLEAIQKARVHQPDLILLDIELPVLTGLEAARRILAHDPSAKILFLSLHRSWDIAEAALSTGARGYILKPNAGHELLPGMEAVAEGRRFVSTALAGRPVETTMRAGWARSRSSVACSSGDSCSIAPARTVCPSRPFMPPS